MPFRIIREDITRVYADAIVNTANPLTIIGGGTDRAIYEAAGMLELLEERQRIGEIRVGEVAATPAFGLHAEFILHTVGPSWWGGSHGEYEMLASCYRKSLLLAEQLRCKSIAFPLISTGVYGFPKDKALEIAIEEISRFLEKSEMDVTLVVFDRQSYGLSGAFVKDVAKYIDDRYVTQKSKEEYGPEEPERERRRRLSTPGKAWRRRESKPLEDMEGEAFSANASQAFSPAHAAILGAASEDAFAAEKTSELRDEAINYAASGKTPEMPKAAFDETRRRNGWPETRASGKTSELRDEAINYAASGKTPEMPKAAFDETRRKAGGKGFFGSKAGRQETRGASPVYGKRSLSEIMDQVGESFQTRLLRLIDERGLTDVEVYKKANVDRKLFSKIRCNPEYTPKKSTAVAFAIALELNLDETVDLLRRAGLALSPSSKFDLIVEFCIANRMYNVFEINALLFSYDQPLLGC